MGGGWGNEESFSNYTVLYAYVDGRLFTQTYLSPWS